MENERRFMRGTNALLPGQGFITAELMPPQQAVIAYLARAELRAPQTEEPALEEAFGRLLACDIVSDRAYPLVSRSTMDGFALRANAAAGSFQIIGSVSMGRLWDGVLRANEAVRIATGGALPDGADTVVPIEQAEVENELLTVSGPVRAGDCITRPGDDIQSGEVLLTRGRRIGAPEAAVLATLGIARVPVFVRPRIGVLSSGDELVGVGDSAGPAQVRDSNRYAIAGALQAAGAHPVPLPVVPDEPGALEAAMRRALPDCDALFLTGGSSVGERDYTPRAISALGPPGVIVHGLRVKPGKPTVLAAVDGKAVIGLPGNPTSALIILEAVCGPIVRALTGNARRPLGIDAIAGETIRGREGWTWYVPVRLHDDGERYVARSLPLHSSSASLPARADGFITMEEGCTEITSGATVRVHPLTEGLS